MQSPPPGVLEREPGDGQVDGTVPEPDDLLIVVVSQDRRRCAGADDHEVVARLQRHTHDVGARRHVDSVLARQGVGFFDRGPQGAVSGAVVTTAVARNGIGGVQLRVDVEHGGRNGTILAVWGRSKHGGYDRQNQEQQRASPPSDHPVFP